IAWQVVGTARVGPDQLAYFNELAGGPEGGHRVVVDSSLDWGQDLAGLARWLEARGNPEIALAYLGNSDPGASGVRWQPFFATRPPGAPGPRFGAVSASYLFGLLDPHGVFRPLRAAEPVAIIGHTIYVFDLTTPSPRASGG